MQKKGNIKKILGLSLSILLAFSTTSVGLFADGIQSDDEIVTKQVEKKAAENITPNYALFDYTDNYTDYGIKVSELHHSSSSKAYSLLCLDNSAEDDASCWVLLKSKCEMNFNAYGPKAVVAGPDYHYTLQFENQEQANDAVAGLSNDEDVIYAELDGTVSLDPSDEVIESNDVNNSAESNTTNHLSWGCNALKTDEFAASVTSTNSVVVAILDTGVNYNHEFLKDRIYKDANGAVIGYDYGNGDSDPIDDQGHGTHCAGIVADCTQGLNVKIMPVKVFQGDGASDSAIINGIKYACEHGANVISMSFGGYYESESDHNLAMDDAINAAIAKGITVCIAGGNGDDNNNPYDLSKIINCPAHIPGAITVSAIDSNNTIASWSDYGDVIDLCGPGVSILSSYYTTTKSYGAMSGTSMACPHIAACSAMLLLDNPGLTPAQVAGNLKASCKDLGVEGKDVRYGCGLPQMDYFVKNKIKNISLVAGAKTSFTDITGNYSSNALTGLDTNIAGVTLTGNGAATSDTSSTTISIEAKAVGTTSFKVGTTTYNVTVTEGTKIATIGETGYSTVADFKTAWDTMSGSATVTLLSDVDLGSSFLTVKDGQNVTLNLNGYELKTSGAQAIKVIGGDLTINDTGNGKVIGSNRALFADNNVTTASNVVINGGSFTGGAYGVFARTNTNVTINGGSFTNTTTSDGYYAAFKAFCANTFVINGGTFTGPNYSLVIDYTGASATITGGTFNGDIFNDRGSLTISGGDFSTNVSPYCASGYTPKTSATGRYIVTAYATTDVVAEINGKRYPTLQSAINDKDNTSGTIKLLENAAEQIVIPEGKNFTIDLDGYSLSYPSGATITNYGTVKISNNNEDSDSYIYAGVASSDYCLVNCGTMYLDSNIYLYGYTNVYNYQGNLEYSATTDASAVGIAIKDGSVVVKADAVAYGGSYGIYSVGGSVSIEGGSVSSSQIGIFSSDGSITVNGGSIFGYYAGVLVYGNSSFAMTNGDVYGYASVANSENNEAIQAQCSAENSTVNSEANSSTIGNGIVVKGGSVNISGGTIQGYGSYLNPTSTATSAFRSTGDALSIEGDCGTITTINISGGTFSSTNAHAIAARFSSSSTTKATINVTGGYFKSANGKDTIYEGNSTDGNTFDGTISVSGGYYSSAFDFSMLSEGKELIANTDDQTKATYPYVIDNIYYIITTHSDAGICQGGGPYAYGSTVTLKASDMSGWSFEGWYKGTNSDAVTSGTKVSSNQVYSFTSNATNAGNYVANYTLINDGKFSLSVAGSAFTVNGNSQTGSCNLTLSPGEVTVKYTDESKTFLYWVNGSGALVSTNAEYTFYLIGSTTLKAVATSDTANSAIVLFRNSFISGAQELQAERYTCSGEQTLSISYPSTPSSYGRSFDHWAIGVLQADGSYKAGEVATEENITAAIRGGAKYVMIAPVYISDGTYTITLKSVNDSRSSVANDLTYTVNTGKTYTLTAPSVEGESFSHWEDANGNVIGTNNQYTVLSPNDVTIYAVYGASIDPVSTIIMNASRGMNGENYRMTFSVVFSIDNSKSIVKRGFLYSTTSTDLTYGNKDSLNCYEWDSATGNTGAMVFNLSTTDASKTVNIISYVVTSSGEVIYGNQMSVSYNSLGSN